jgi:hypothetical protein
MSEGDDRAQALALEAGCCGNEEWRGRFCQYHMGFADGFDAALLGVRPPPEEPPTRANAWPAGPPEGPPSFTCPRCGATSFSPGDVRAGYCGACNDWTGPSLDLAR